MAIVMVTGGAGFIGSNYIRYALDRTPYYLLVLDKLTYAGSLENLPDVSDNPRLRFVRGDIGDPDCVGKCFRRWSPVAVINFAAESHVDRSIDTPRPFIDTNVTGTLELLQSTRLHYDSLKGDERDAFRFLHVSTDEVFGSLGESGAFEETTPYAPNSPYAASKAAADHLVRAYHHTYGLPTIITNCSNNYGPYQFPEKLIPLMILNALEGKALPIYGDGLNVRDWLYVEDHCHGVQLAWEKGRVGESYNLGGHGERNNLQVVDAICDALEKFRPAADNAALKAKGLDSYKSLKSFVEDRLGHDRRYAIDPTKAEGELGWKPQRDFETGLEETVRWYLEHPDWCKKIEEQSAYHRQRLGNAEVGR